MERILTMCFRRYHIPNEIIWKIMYEFNGFQHKISKMVIDSLYSGEFFMIKYKSKAEYQRMFITCDCCKNFIDYDLNVCIMINTNEIRWYLPISSIKSSDDSFTLFIYNKFYPNEMNIYYTFLNKILKENLTIICSNCDKNYWNKI